ncbi:MAG: hypothetical protein C5B52_06410 [Bacteroidetes bacterium]|nr:MAG: hypothetical protein C5B52_06410 [Bacteroidota bacterium]
MYRPIIILSIFAVALFSSCGTSKNFSSPEDKDLSQLVKKLNKKSGDLGLQNSLKTLYAQSQQKHEDNIAVYRKIQSLDKWNKILSEYSELQKVYDLISSSTVAYGIINPVNYYSMIDDVKHEAASEFFDAGMSFMTDSSRESYRRAYDAFDKALQYAPDFSEAQKQKQFAFQSSIINVVINPLQDFSNGYFPGWDAGFQRNYLQENLVRDLGGANAFSVPARYYTDRQAAASNIIPNWIVDLKWNNVFISPERQDAYTRNVSKLITLGTDSSGHEITETVYATLNVTRIYVEASAVLDYHITDALTKNNIEWNSLSTDYNWQEEYASYSGDSRALSPQDWAMINYARTNLPSRRDIMDEMTRRIYTDLRSRIKNSTDW